MNGAIFLRALDAPAEEKGERLRHVISALRRSKGEALPRGVFTEDIRDFAVIPGSPFAYWASDDIRRIFREFPPLEGNAAAVKQGLATADDFRFVRAWWEVAPERIGYSGSDTLAGRGWVHFAKGGSYSPYYADVHLLVNWFDNGRALKAYAERTPGTSHWSRRIPSVDYYFRPGLTWPRRTDGLSFRPLPMGCVFADKGPAMSSYAS